MAKWSHHYIGFHFRTSGTLQLILAKSLLMCKGLAKADFEDDGDDNAERHEIPTEVMYYTTDHLEIFWASQPSMAQIPSPH
jgi:predicted chitinase